MPVRADVSRALDVVVAAVNVRTAAALAGVAERELQRVVAANIRGAVMMLRATHAPDQRARSVLRHYFGDLIDKLLRRTGNVGHDIRRVALHDFPNLVHAVYAAADVRFIFPAVLEDVPKYAPNKGGVRARADTHVQIRVCRGAREAWIDHDNLRAVFLTAQHVLHRHRMRFRGVAADEEHALAVVLIVVGVGHGAETVLPRRAAHRRRVADARLVVAVVRPPEREELALQV